MLQSRFFAFADLSAQELAALRGLVGSARTVPAGETLRWEGDPEPGVFFLHEGWLTSSIRLANGARQIVKIHLVGDVLGAPSLPFTRSVESLTALTSCKVSPISLTALRDVFATFPRLAVCLFLAAQEERVFLMDRLTSLGRLGAKGSLQALLLHLHDRLRLVMPEQGPAMHVPLTQADIADVLGLTVVHVNRVLRQLEREGEIVRVGRTFQITDVERLRQSVSLPERIIARNLAWLPPTRPSPP